MNVIKRIAVFGDSILKGIQLNPQNMRYQIDNHIDIGKISGEGNAVVENHARFGCTITKGYALLQKRLESGINCDTIIMDYGGNDCDFDWKAVSERPEEEHEPHTPLAVFVDTYQRIIHTLKERGILPILATLPPLEPEKFFRWVARGLDQDTILRWLCGVNSIYRFQENYSRTVEKIAREERVPLVDLRGAFLRNRRIDRLLCEDGTHPNTEGQSVITAAFLEFAGQYGAAEAGLEVRGQEA